MGWFLVQPQLAAKFIRFAETSQHFGLTKRLGKTEVHFQPGPGTTPHPPPTISIAGTTLKTVVHFKYLGGIISSEGSLNKEIAAGISKASQALGLASAPV